MRVGIRVIRSGDLRRAVERVSANVHRKLGEVAEHVAAGAAQRAPVDEGQLKANIFAQEVAPLRWRVVATKEYAAFQEFGTGIRGASSPQPGPVPGVYVHGPSIGMRAQPFLRPAFYESLALVRSEEFWRTD